MDFVKGQLVKSKAGRDRGEFFIVYEVVDEKNVLIVDGKIRKLEKPKLKKTMHLSRTTMKSNILDEIDIRDLSSQNRKVKRAIENLLCKK